MKLRCPICRKPTDSETSEDFPFCSERCRLIDLGNWASEKYVVGEPLMDESESEASPLDSRQSKSPNAYPKRPPNSFPDDDEEKN